VGVLSVVKGICPRKTQKDTDGCGGCAESLFKTGLQDLQDSILQGNLVNLVILSKSRELFVAFGVFRGHSHSAKPPRPLRASRTLRETFLTPSSPRPPSFFFRQDYRIRFLKTPKSQLVFDKSVGLSYNRPQVKTKEVFMSTTTISARIDSKKKKEAEELFAELGMSLSTAINLFINESIAYQGIPFEIRRRNAKPRDMLEAMTEARAIAADPAAKRYDDLDELFADALK
jgi:DNA-damage-inducible protein J